MKTLLAAAVFTVAAVCGGVETFDLPHPWLSFNRGAKVLQLRCGSPENIDLKRVHDLRLSAFLSQHSVSSNISLANMTSSMEEPKVNRMFTNFDVSFEGTWSTRSVSLDLRFPVTRRDLGRYFCMVVYTDHDDKHLELTTEVTVDHDFVFSHTDISPKSKNNFEINVIEAHEVSVTWQKPENARFQEASVSRILVDAEENSIAPFTTLLTTNGVKHFVYDPEHVLLTKVHPNDSGNFSIALFVKRDKYSPPYRYSCNVPYPACTGHRSVFCTCCKHDPDPDIQKCPLSEDRQLDRILFVIFLVLSIIFALIIIAALIVFCLYKTGYSTNARLVNIFKVNRPSTKQKRHRKNPTKNGSDPHDRQEQESKELMMEGTATPQQADDCTSKTSLSKHMPHDSTTSGNSPDYVQSHGPQSSPVQNTDNGLDTSAEVHQAHDDRDVRSVTRASREQEAPPGNE